MTTGRQVVTDEQLGLYSKREKELYDRLRFGIGGVDFDIVMGEMQLLIEGNPVVAQQDTAVDDTLRPFRCIKGLIVIGPKEWEKAMQGQNRCNRNPLKLKAGWCPQIPVPYTVGQMEELVKFCQTTEWATIPVLWLALPEVGGVPTSLTNQRNWWGVKHDEFVAGTIRSDILWSGWFSGKDYAWAEEPAVTEPTWVIGYELPRWMTGLSWNNQQRVARKRRMPIATAGRDALMCNLVAITAGRKFRFSVWSRTATIYGGGPLRVHWGLGYGLGVYRRWCPGVAFGHVGASVEGVPVEIGL